MSMHKAFIIAVFLLIIIIAWPSDSWSQPSIAIKAGGWAGAENSHSAGVTHGFIYSLESGQCGNHCISPNIVRVSTKYGKNMGGGLDYVYRPELNSQGQFRLSVGAARFHKRLNGGEQNNIHLAVAFEARLSKVVWLVLSYDHYSNGRKAFNRSNVQSNIPINLITAGLRF